MEQENNKLSSAQVLEELTTGTICKLKAYERILSVDEE
jgi:hypothetical protein